MLGLKHSSALDNNAINGLQTGVFPQLNERPKEITQESLAAFLNTPRRTRLTKSHDFPFLAPFEIAARLQGQLIFSQWLEDISPFRAIHELQAEVPAVDLFQLSLVTARLPVDATKWQESLSRNKNGRFGLEVSLHNTKYRVSPLETIATNRPLDRWFANLLEERRLPVEDFFAIGGQVQLLECKQFLLQCGKSGKAVETFRGNRLVDKELPAKSLAETVISGISRWFMANQDQHGALPYKYWPSSGQYSTADNPIRSFMASVAFNRMAIALERHDMKTAARKNLDYNLRRFYRFENGKGTITWQGTVKLGALAMAALAIIESPFAETWKDELAQLRQTIDCLWQPSGAFRTFLLPADRNDNQNFYPGEALLFWATSLDKQPDKELLDRALKSFFHYRSHFRRNPNPAFVPWHSQAAAILFRLTGEPDLREFIFEMNDWLLPHQQWGEPLDHDYFGRFYTPGKPSYGPPHASATGVYLEGLVDAMSLAHQSGDQAHGAAYELAINRGIRSLAQLQFRDDIDAYYVSRRDRVIGAIRTEADDNEIRIDNLQHGLMALLRYRAIKRLNAQDATSSGSNQVSPKVVAA